ncbi:mucin-22-like [Branchiostoma lanceolatum]|uniref:mucin-22-like n=1 Tax=Branchiostoma lanceolatum TaxID=7740 RepID=UPI0034534496
MWKACLSPPVARGILAVLFALFVSGSDSLTVTVDSESPTTLISGEDGYLVCTFTPASPTFILTWRRETYTVYTKLQVMGSVLTSIAYGSLRGRAEIVDDVTLKIKGVEKSDAATYECEVSDMSGSDSGESSAFVEVFVVDNPSPPECSVSSDNLVAGTNASLSCSSTSGRESSPQWYQQLSNGSLLEVGNKTADWSKLTYDLNVTKQDGGAVYVCLEEHPEPIKSRNCSVTLDISYVDTPVINATSPLEIQKGDPLILVCDVESRPVADVMWVLPSGQSRQGAHLKLPVAERRHEGVYSCVANITAGGVQLVTGATVEVTVTVIALTSSTPFMNLAPTEQAYTRNKVSTTFLPDETTATGANVTGTPATSKPNEFEEKTVKRATERPNTVKFLSEAQKGASTQTPRSQANTFPSNTSKQTLSMTRAAWATSTHTRTIATDLDASSQPSAVAAGPDTYTLTTIPTTTTSNGSDTMKTSAMSSDIETTTQTQVITTGADQSVKNYTITPVPGTLTLTAAKTRTDLGTSMKASNMPADSSAETQTHTMATDVTTVKQMPSMATTDSSTWIRAMATDALTPTGAMASVTDTLTHAWATTIGLDKLSPTNPMASGIHSSTQATAKTSTKLNTSRQPPTMTSTSYKSSQTLLISTDPLQSSTARSDWVKTAKGSPQSLSTTPVRSTRQAMSGPPQAVSQATLSGTETGPSHPIARTETAVNISTGTDKGLWNRNTVSQRQLQNTARPADEKGTATWHSAPSSVITPTKTVTSQTTWIPQTSTNKEDEGGMEIYKVFWTSTSQDKTSSSATPPLDRFGISSSYQSSPPEDLEMTATSTQRLAPDTTKRTTVLDTASVRSSTTVDRVYRTVERIFPTDGTSDRSAATTTVMSLPSAGHSEPELELRNDATTFRPTETHHNKTGEESTPPLPSTTSSTPGDKCLKDYVLHDGSCFKAFPKAVTYSEAEETCAAEGGIVAPTKTEEHQRLIRKLVYSVKPLANFWIGLDDRRAEGVWRWSDGTVLRAEDFQTWVPGEPNNYQGTQHCGRYWASMEQWDDVVCYVRYLFVCQIGQPSANTQSYTPANVVQTSAVRITRSPNKGTTRPTPLQNDEEEREAEKEDITMANSSYVHNKTTLQLNQVGRPSVKESLPGWKVSLIIIFTIVGLAILALLVAFFLRSKFFRFKRSIMPVAEPQSTQEYGSKTKLDP